MAENDKEKTGFHTKEGVYCFTHMPKELKNSAVMLQRIIKKVLADQRGQNMEVYLEEIVVKSKMEEGRFLGHMVTKEGIRADPEKVQTIIQSPTPKSLNQIRSYFLQLKAISKFIPKLVELKYPIREVRMRFETTEGSGWTNEAEESLRRIKRKLNKLQALAITKEGEVLMLCLQQRSETISSMLLVEREGIQIHVSYVSRPLQAMEICYTPMEKMVHALIHTIRSLRTIFRKHKEAEGSVVKKFFGQGKQVQETPDANEGEMSNLSKKLQAKSTPTPRAWSPDEKMHSYAIRLKFNASNHAIDCEALLAGLAASVSKGMKDLHVFINSLTLVAKIEGNHTPTMEQERKYKEEIINATAPFHMFRITYLPKILNSKAEVLTGLATIKLEFLNQEVSVGIKTRPSMEETSSSKKEKVASNVPRIKPNYNWGTSRSN
ncbi:reverse transcriptase domain-containing protein [Tanacetum coccineum]